MARHVQLRLAVDDHTAAEIGGQGRQRLNHEGVGSRIAAGQVCIDVDQAGVVRRNGERDDRQCALGRSVGGGEPPGGASPAQRQVSSVAVLAPAAGRVVVRRRSAVVGRRLAPLSGSSADWQRRRKSRARCASRSFSRLIRADIAVAGRGLRHLKDLRRLRRCSALRSATG